MASELSSPPATAQVRTFLIADIRGYTQFTVDHGDSAAARLAARFAQMAREVVDAHEGEVIELRGDEALAVFTSARQALRAAADLQTRFTREAADDPSLPMRVGIGLDAGEALPVDGGFRGAALNLAARLCSLAGSGEILASETVTNIARKLNGLEYRERGAVQLKGFTDPVRVMQITAEPAESELPEENVHQVPQPFEQRLPIGGFLGALPSGSLIGREQELGHLLAIVGAASGEGRTVLLSGEPGAGKTRLAQEATLSLRNLGFLITAGRCYEPEQDVPYYPFLDVLSALYTAAPPAIQRDAKRRWPYLGVLLPDQITLPEIASGDQNEQQRVFRAVASFVEAIATERPVALLLDDLHWADAASLKLLHHLARHTRTLPVLLLGTYRDVEVGEQHPLRAMLRDLQREALVERIDVRRLDERGTKALVEATLGQTGISKEFTQLLYGRTEGNPYFVRQVLQALVERGDVYREEGRWERRALEEIEVPESVRAVIDQRLAQLPEETQEILREASVLGQTFDFDDLEVLASRSESAIETSLDAAVARGLVRTAGKDSYAFDHALTQHTLYTDIPPRRRRRLHLAAGEAMERLPDRVKSRRTAELARHFLEGDDTERAISYALMAGEQAQSVFAHEEAERQFRAVLTLLEGSDDTERRARALLGLGTALSSRALYDEALTTLEEAATLYKVLDDLRGEARAVAEIGQVHRARATPKEGLARIQPILPALENEPPSQELADLYVKLAQLFFLSGRHADVLDASARAIEVAQAVGNMRLLAAAKVRYGTALGNLGRDVEGVRVLEEAIALGEETGDFSTLRVAYNNLSEAHRLAGDLVPARDLRARALESAERSGEPAYIAFASSTLGSQEFFLGNWAEARSLIERALEIVRSLGPSWYSGAPLIHMGELCRAEGDLTAASSYLNECLELVAGLPTGAEAVWSQSALGEVEILQGHPERARARLEKFVERLGIDHPDAFHPIWVLAWALLASGYVPRAEELTAHAVAATRSPRTRFYLPDALRVYGMVLAEQERWDEAEHAFQEARTIAQSMPYPHAEARILHTWGTIELRRESSDRGPALLQEALTIFQRLGATQDIDQTAELLAVSS